MPPKISTFIPVYRESELLEPLLNQLLGDSYGLKEIFVIIDEPTDRSLDTIKKFETSVNFILNGDRKGKVNVLNEAVEKSDGEILLFLDSDVFIPSNQGSFLQTIYEEMENAEIIEVKKKIIRDSLLARSVHYDYLSFNSSNLMFSRMLGKCLGLNGAAFAIKRETFDYLGGFRRAISEDLDIGTRAFIKECKFKFVDRAEVYIKVSPSWRQWFNQRKRWGVGAGLWFRDHFRDLLSSVRKYPKVLLPTMLLILPSLPLFIINMLIPEELYPKFLSILLLVLATKGASFFYPPLLLASSVTFLRNAVTAILSFGAYLFTFYSFARKLSCTFEPLSFAFFYFVYSPIWLFILVLSLIKVYLKSGSIDVNWKV